MTTVLLPGSGGREHALGRVLVTGPSAQLHAAPEGPGLAGIGTLHTVDPSDPAAVAALARRVGANPVAVGPEAPLVTGVADVVRETGIGCFGLSAAVAEPEGSKVFVKGVMRAVGVPTASARVYATPGEAAAAPDAYDPPYVVKNDGLTAGKGVVVTPDRTTAPAHVEAYRKVVIEEFLNGPKPSLFVIYDGVTAVSLLPTQDFKRVGDGDAGPNTGDMGAYCPLPWAPGGLVEEAMTRMIAPTLTEVRRRGTPPTRLLYVGLALTTRGVRAMKFSAHSGDPKTQVVLALLETSLAGVLCAASCGELAGLLPPRWHGEAAVMVVETARSYPGTPVGGGNIDLPADTDRAWTVYAGAKATGGRLIASRGRVLGTIGLREDLDQVRGRVYERLLQVDSPDGFHRIDIGISR